MILRCEGCNLDFGGPKTLDLHLDNGQCLDPKTVDRLELSDAKIWRKRSGEKINTRRLRGAEYQETVTALAIERRVRAARWGILRA